MALSRRRLLVAAASVPAVVAIGRAHELVAAVLDGAVRHARPGATGTTASRCAQCGSPDHAMLDPGCPLAPRVRA